MPIIGRGGIVVHEISAPGMGSGGATADDWVRPADWIALPTLVDGDEKVVGVYAVYNHDSNFVALRCSGAYTVDWGDGGAPEDVAANTTAEHCYDSDDYAALGAGTDCSRGYRQALVSITPQAGQNLTAVSFNYKHSQAGLNAYRSQWLDIAVAGGNITSMVVGGTTGNLAMLEQFQFVGTANAGLTNMESMFQLCYSLQSIPLFDTGSVQNMSSMFHACRSLQAVPLLDTSSVKNMSNMFQYCYSLQSVPLLDTSSVTTMTSMFAYCYSLQSVQLIDTSIVKNMANMFYNCRSLQSVPLLDTSSVTTMAGMFESCVSLGAAALQGTLIDHSFASCKLARDELVAIFQGLGTVTGKTITITGNWGIAALSAGDRAIATAKGWTIAE
jgi:surface protein